MPNIVKNIVFIISICWPLTHTEPCETGIMNLTFHKWEKETQKCN